MTKEEMLNLAKEAGFDAAVIPADDVPCNASFRPYCAENLCGQYDSNYSCPPTCGTPEDMEDKIKAGEIALVLKTEWPIKDYKDVKAILHGKRSHNEAELQLFEKLKAAGYEGFCIGASCCDLCNPCKGKLGEPCTFPDKQFSCMSAYCIDVSKLAELTGLRFAWVTDTLFSYGMIVMK